MHPQKMFALAGGECCQCENVATTKSNSQFSGDIAAADKLETGNIGTGNTSTMATINMIAESKPAEKEMMVNLVMTFLA